MSGRPVVIVSNRGPVAFTRTDEGLQARRGAGGLVSGLAPVVAGSDAVWVAAALSDGDREAARSGVVDAEGLRVRTLALDPEDQRLHYDVICNEALWFAHHGLFSTAREPVLDRAWWHAWDAYRRVNDAFAAAVADVAPRGAAVLVQDYHLALVGERLAAVRPDLATVHFSHTPFAPPDGLAVLPGPVRTELLAGMAAHGACGFHTARWEAAFTACCDADAVPRPRTFVAPLGPDPDDIAATVRSPACTAALAELDEILAGRALVTRVDRIELSKNLLRGFAAYDDLLDRHPELRERVVFGAFVYPSREGVPAYAAYRTDVEAAVADLNRRWGTPGWQPVLYDDSDDYPRSVAALQRADVLLVNPVRDGLNLVAKEGPLVNGRDAVLVLSTQAGAWEELDGIALGVHPFDVRATSDALHHALTMDPAERHRRARDLKVAATASTPTTWVAAQVAAAG